MNARTVHFLRWCYFERACSLKNTDFVLRRRRPLRTHELVGFVCVHRKNYFSTQVLKILWWTNSMNTKGNTAPQKCRTTKLSTRIVQNVRTESKSILNWILFVSKFTLTFIRVCVWLRRGCAVCLSCWCATNLPLLYRTIVRLV